MALQIQDILRAGDTKRWTIVRTAVLQSVAEHTFNVVMIARALSSRLGYPDEIVIKAALEHDLDEVLTGDIPSSLKARMPKLDKLMKRDLTTNGINHQNLSQMARTIVKVADLIEAYWFILENSVGRHAGEVARNCRLRLMRYIETLDEETSEIVRELLNDILHGEFVNE